MIALAVLVFAYAIKGMSHSFLEEENLFITMIVLFAVMYVASAALISWIDPPLAAKANILSVIETLSRRW